MVDVDILLYLLSSLFNCHFDFCGYLGKTDWNGIIISSAVYSSHDNKTYIFFPLIILPPASFPFWDYDLNLAITLFWTFGNNCRVWWKWLSTALASRYSYWARDLDLYLAPPQIDQNWILQVIYTAFWLAQSFRLCKISRIWHIFFLNAVCKIISVC